jgi:Glutathione S-transferase
MRARLALNVSGIVCELREVKLSAKPEAMLTASPKGTVPVLVLSDGKVIDESIDIMRWALSHSDPQRWLEGDDPELIEANDGPFKHHLDRYKYPHRHDSDPDHHREQGLSFLKQLDERLLKSGHLSGRTSGMTDAAIVPFVRQFAAVEPDWFESLPLPALKGWLHAYLSSPLFIGIMIRREPWRPGDAPASFP